MIITIMKKRDEKYKSKREIKQLKHARYTNNYTQTHDGKKKEQTNTKKCSKIIITTTTAQVTIPDMRDTLYSCIIQN